MKDTRIKGFWNIPKLRRAIEASNMAGESHHGGPERPLYEEDVRGTRAVGYLQRRAADREWNKTKKKKNVVGSKYGKMDPSKPFDIRHRTTRFLKCNPM